MKKALEFFRGRRGDVISRLPNGKIVVIDKKSSRRPKAGEVWKCTVIEKERVAIARPLAKKITRTLREIVTYKCGHVRVSTFEKEVFEDEEIEDIQYSLETLCDQCTQRIYEEVEEFKEKIDSNINGNEELTKISKEKQGISRKITELRNKIIDLEIQRFLRVPKQTTKGNEKWSNPTCYCGREIDISGLRDGEIIQCQQCRREYKLIITIDDETGGMHKQLLDLDKEQEIKEEISKIEQQIQRLQEEWKQLDEQYTAIRNNIVMKHLKNLGVKEIKINGRTAIIDGIKYFNDERWIPEDPYDTKQLKIATALDFLV